MSACPHTVVPARVVGGQQLVELQRAQLHGAWSPRSLPRQPVSLLSVAKAARIVATQDKSGECEAVGLEYLISARIFTQQLDRIVVRGEERLPGARSVVT